MRSAGVPSCPGWTVEDLSAHLGTIHRWAEHLVCVLSPEPIASADMGLNDGPVDPGWIRKGGAQLVRTLRAADPAAAMWAWGADHHVRFWSRRQLHETLVHRFDLELARGERPSAPSAVAADTIDEFLCNLASAAYFSPKVRALVGNGESLCFRALDTGNAWTIELLPDRFEVHTTETSASANLSGLATDLSLVLTRRVALADSNLEVEGVNLVEFWIANSALE